MSNAEYKSIVATAYTLYFMQLHLYCVNAKGITAEVQIYGLWVSTIWFTSLHRISHVTKNNIVLATIGMVFIVCQSDVEHPRFVTMEPIEHHFGDIQSNKCKFTTLEYNENVQKVHRF